MAQTQLYRWTMSSDVGKWTIKQMFGKQIVHIILLAVTDQKSYLSIIEPIYLYEDMLLHTQRHIWMDEYVVIVKWSKDTIRLPASIRPTGEDCVVYNKHFMCFFFCFLVSVIFLFECKLNNMVIYRSVPHSFIHLPMSVRLSSFKGLKDYTHRQNMYYTRLISATATVCITAL